MMQRSPGKVDSYAAGAMLLGMGNWLSMSLFNFDAVKAVAGHKSTPGRAAIRSRSGDGNIGVTRRARRYGWEL